MRKTLYEVYLYYILNMLSRHQLHIYKLDCLIIIKTPPLSSAFGFVFSPMLLCLKHQFAPLLNLFTLYLVVFFLSYKRSIVPTMPLWEREPSVLFFVFLFFQLSGQDLRESADTYQGKEMAKIISNKQAVSSYLLSLLIPFKNGTFQHRNKLA